MSKQPHLGIALEKRPPEESRPSQKASAAATKSARLADVGAGSPTPARPRFNKSSNPDRSCGAYNDGITTMSLAAVTVNC